MRRLFWVAVGATAGVYAVRKVKRTVYAYTPAGLTERAVGWREAAGDFAAEVRVRMAEREAELRAAMGVEADVTLSPAQAVYLTDHPAAAPPTPATAERSGKPT